MQRKAKTRARPTSSLIGFAAEPGEPRGYLNIFPVERAREGSGNLRNSLSSASNKKHLSGVENCDGERVHLAAPPPPRLQGIFTRPTDNYCTPYLVQTRKSFLISNPSGPTLEPRELQFSWNTKFNLQK
jgi:hypothetical protein